MDLLSDQVFQLNAFLWAVEDLPTEGPIRPVLREAGYSLVAIGRKVLLPPGNAVTVALNQLTGSPDRSACRPDGRRCRGKGTRLLSEGSQGRTATRHQSRQRRGPGQGYQVLGDYRSFRSGSESNKRVSRAVRAIRRLKKPSLRLGTDVDGPILRLLNLCHLESVICSVFQDCRGSFGGRCG